ncbi:MAG TPA: aromatic amino acid lyase, partial [Vicinamibacterales bacterium]|nr:aromatic amino acid lyase [Vicinamibacterales bacterium]
EASGASRSIAWHAHKISMATTSRAREVVAIEILCACQAIDLLAPLASSPALQRVHQLVRSRVPVLDDDRAPAPDIVAITELIATNAFEDACAGLVK